MLIADSFFDIVDDNNMDNILNDDVLDEFDDDHVDVDVNQFMTNDANDFIYDKKTYDDDNNWWRTMINKCKTNQCHHLAASDDEYD